MLKQAVIRRTDTCSYIIIGIENQSEVHYAMPVRNMIYDAMNYGRQIGEAAKKHKKARDWNSSVEFLSGFAKGEKLMPVVTLTVYWGIGKWDGPRSIHEMLQPMDEELLKYVADYRLNLIVPEEITDFSKFRSALGPVLSLFQLADDRKALGREGLMTRLIELTIRRFQKGDSAEAVAELFEEDPQFTSSIKFPACPIKSKKRGSP